MIDEKESLADWGSKEDFYYWNEKFRISKRPEVGEGIIAETGSEWLRFKTCFGSKHLKVDAIWSRG